MKGKRKKAADSRRGGKTIKDWTGMDFASSTRAAKIGQDGKGLLRIHLWCPDDLPRLWDRIENASALKVANVLSYQNYVISLHKMAVI